MAPELYRPVSGLGRRWPSPRSSCRPAAAPAHDDNTIKLTGSDTMVDLAEAWAEAFHEQHPDISLQVKGGGSGVGIAALCSGKIQIATASRPMKPKEIELAKASNSGAEPQRVRRRPRRAGDLRQPATTRSRSISLERVGRNLRRRRQDHDLATDLGVDNPACAERRDHPRQPAEQLAALTPISRRPCWARSASTSRAPPRKAARPTSWPWCRTPPAPSAIAAWATTADQVKVLSVAKAEGRAAAWSPTVQTALDGSYPISRPLYIYTLGEPAGAVQEFVQWVLSPDGAKDRRGRRLRSRRPTERQPTDRTAHGNGRNDVTRTVAAA